MTTVSDTELLRLAEAATPDVQKTERPSKRDHFSICAHAAYIAASTPDRIIALLSEKANLEKEVEDLKASVIAFAAPRAVQYAQEHKLPDRHLYAPHYDLLEQCGARMTDFVRSPPRQALSPNNPAVQAMEGDHG